MVTPDDHRLATFVRAFGETFGARARSVAAAQRDAAKGDAREAWARIAERLATAP